MTLHFLQLLSYTNKKQSKLFSHPMTPNGIIDDDFTKTCKPAVYATKFNEKYFKNSQLNVGKILQKIIVFNAFRDLCFKRSVKKKQGCCVRSQILTYAIKLFRQEDVGSLFFTSKSFFEKEDRESLSLMSNQVYSRSLMRANFIFGLSNV